MSFTLLSLLAQAEQPSAAGPVMMIIVFIAMYFMLIRPQRRAQKEHMERIAALKSGDEVVVAGIHGLITNVAERTVTLKIADNVKIKVDRASIGTILKKSDEPEPASATGETAA